MRIGLVLSGGGARGLAHLGILEGLDQLGIRPSVISGVSAGAIIGALYAAGNSPRKILEIARAQSSYGIARLFFTGRGLFSTAGLRQILKTWIPGDSFESLKIPLFVTATDIAAGKSVTFSQGELYDAVIGSSAIPAVAGPVPLGTFSLVDGGVLDNFPVGCILSRSDVIIGSHVNKLYNGHVQELTRLQVLERCFHLAIADSIALKAQMCNVFIEPALAGYSMFDMRKADKIFEAGYDAVMTQRETLTLTCNDKGQPAA